MKNGKRFQVRGRKRTRAMTEPTWWETTPCIRKREREKSFCFVFSDLRNWEDLIEITEFRDGGDTRNKRPAQAKVSIVRINGNIFFFPTFDKGSTDRATE